MSQPNLIDSIREARQLGATVEAKHRTGELVFEHQLVGRQTCNARRKDTPRSVTAFLRRLRRLEQGNEISGAQTKELEDMAKQKKGPLTAPAKFIVSGASPGKFVPHVAIREPSAPPAREVVEITSVLTATVIEPNEVSFSLDGTLRIGTAFKPLADADKGLIVGFDRQSVIDDVPTVYLIRSASPTEPGVVLIQERGPFTETTGVHLNKAVVAQLQLAAHCKPTDQYARYRRLCPATIEVIGGRRYIVVDATAGRDAALKTALRGAKRLAAAAAEEE